MFAGHFGLAAAVKTRAPEVPLWALLIGTQLLDIAFLLFFSFGAETIEGTGYGQLVIHADYTHSLVGALLLSLLGGLISALVWGRKGGYVIGAVIFSHWILDLLVHRPDLPILPGNFGGLPLLGFGLWKTTWAAMLLETVLIAAGSLLYLRHVLKGTPSKSKRFGMVKAGLLGVLLVLALVNDVLS